MTRPTLAAGCAGASWRYRLQRVAVHRRCSSCNCTAWPCADAHDAVGRRRRLACAPTLAYEVPGVPLRISGSQDSIVRTSHAPGELVTINAGTRSGIAVGQEYTRRVLASRDGAVGPGNPATIRTTGWIRVWAVDEEMSLATISHACETVDVNDFLEPFAAPTIPVTSTSTSDPERGNYALVLSGQDRRTQFGRGDYLLIDRGSNQGVTPVRASWCITTRRRREISCIRSAKPSPWTSRAIPRRCMC